MSNLDEPQLKILRVLLFHQSVRFTDLNTQEMSSDHFNYHLKKLIKEGLVNKNSDDLYELTENGKNLAGEMDGLTKLIEKQHKTVVVAVCTKKMKGKDVFLVQIRKRQPMFGYYCLPGGKSRTGETLEEAVLRELEEETGLRGKPILKQIKHVIKTSEKTKQIITDDVLYCFLITDISGDFLEETNEGKNEWLTVEQIQKLDKVLLHTVDSIKAIFNQNITYKEERFTYQDV